MSVNPKIELTADGSHTLFVPELDEHYHSVNGAVQESTHVFIKRGLYHCAKDEIQIFEVGFGTGLNAFLSMLDIAETNKIIHYTAIEAYPLDENIIQQLNYAKSFSAEEQALYEKLHDVEWGSGQEIIPNFRLTKIESDFTQFDFSSFAGTFDLIYFDAFAPDKQPEMWTQYLFDNMYRISAEGGVLVTYCAKGVVRRMLQTAGYTTERLPGPPGKREMLRATKLSEK